MIKTKLHKPKGSKFWKLFVEHEGKYKLVFKSYSKTEANKERVKVQANTIDTAAMINKMTFVNLYNEFVLAKIDEANQPLGPKYHSVKSYISYFKKWINPFFDKKVLLNDVTVDVAETFFKKIYNEGASWITANNVVSTFKTALGYAKRKQYISSIGQMDDFKARKTTALKAPNPEEMQYKKTPMITLQESKRLLKLLYPKDNDIIGMRNFTIASVFVFCGLRTSELRPLRWHNINLKLKKLSVKDTLVGSVQGSGKSKAARRTFTIHPFLKKTLMMWRRVHYSQFKDRTSYVFPSVGHYQDIPVPVCGRTITDFLKIAYSQLGLAKIKLIPLKGRFEKSRIVVEECKFGKNPTRTFRHFSSTSLCDAQAGNPVLTDNFIKNYQGHENIELTKGLYGNHLNRDDSPERLEQEVKALGQAIPINWEEISQ